jgi:hypothetical protein
MFKPTPTSHIAAPFVVGTDALAIGHRRRAQAVARMRPAERDAGDSQPLAAGNRATAHRARFGTTGPAGFAIKRWAALPTLALAVVILSLSTLAHADCPSGVRTVSEREQQAVESTSEAIRQALPATPAGWSLKEQGVPPKNVVAAAVKPAWTVCAGGDPSPHWSGIYVWDELAQRNQQRQAEHDARMKAASAYTPEEQAELGELGRQARDLERKAIWLMRTDPAESARLRAAMKPFTDKAGALRMAHDQRVAPQLNAMHKEHAAQTVDPRVNVSVSLHESAPAPEGWERLQIAGATSAFFNESRRELWLSFGRFPAAKESGGLGTKPRVLTVLVQGLREPAETIARSMAGSNLRTLGKP